MKITHYIFFLILSFVGLISLSCSKSKSFETKHVGRVVLIFENYPDSINIRKMDKGFIIANYDIHYLNDSLYPQYYNVNSRNKSDTLKINTSRVRIEMFHRYAVLYGASYLINNGDTVLFNYKDKFPKANILNRETSDIQLNYDIRRAGYRRAPNNIKSLISRKEISRSKERDYYYDKFNQEKLYLDSLYKIGSISEFDYNYRYNNLVSKSYIYAKKSEVLQEKNIISDILDDSTTIVINNDSLLYYISYRNILSYRLNQKLAAIPMLGGEGFSRPDYKARYDTIATADFLSSNAKKHFMSIELDNIFKEEDIHSIEEYNRKFETVFIDTIFTANLKKKHKIDFSEKDELLLEDINGNKYTLNKILNRHKGKIIYVDLWASWCAPCISLFPDSKELKKEFSDKDVVFLYLAFKDKKEDWLKACKTHGVMNDSYIVTNSITSSFITEMKISEIPRYLIIGKKGKLVHKDAPRPNAKEIRDMLYSLLNN